MKARIATLEDYQAWLLLAKEAEPLFGPMVEDPHFREALEQAIVAGNALCAGKAVRERAPVLPGGIVISPEQNEILWLAVAAQSRRQGIGKALIEAALNRLDPNRPVTVTTFDESAMAGIPARRLYETFGFVNSRTDGANPAGIPVVVMLLPNKR